MPRFPSRSAGSALLLTLAVLLLVSVLVVSLVSTIGIERVAAHSSYENQIAHQYAQMAVTRSWRPSATTSRPILCGLPRRAGSRCPPQTAGASREIPLHSGQAAGATSGTGQVDINAPIMGSAGQQRYPILSPNTEFPGQTPMPIAWVDVLQNGTQYREGGGTPSTAANPVVGRYAYWTDTETSKVNLNTAGLGQTSYTVAQSGGNFSRSDSQDLTGAPSRVDLSQLDDDISPAASLATYHDNTGSYFLNETMGAISTAPPVPNDTPQVAATATPPQSGQRFNSIEEWANLTKDPGDRRQRFDHAGASRGQPLLSHHPVALA